MPSFRTLVQNVAAACRPKSRKSPSDLSNHPLAKLSSSGGSFSRLNLSLSSTLQRTKRALQRQDPEEEEEEDWGCFEAMAISRSPTLQLSAGSSPHLTSSPSSSNSSYCISSGVEDYFSLPRSRSEDSAISLNSIITAYSNHGNDFDLSAPLPCPIPPRSPASISRSPASIDRSFPTTPVMSASPALPSLPRLLSFEKTIEEAITNLEITVQKVASFTASVTVQQIYDQPQHLEYAFGYATPLPEDYEESDSGSEESFCCEGLDMSELAEDLDTLVEIGDRLRLDYGFTPRQGSMLPLVKGSVALSSTERFVLRSHMDRETRYKKKVYCYSRNKKVTKNKPASLLAMQASVRNATLAHGVPQW